MKKEIRTEHVITIFKFDDESLRKDYFDIDKVSNIKYIETIQLEELPS